MLRVALQQPLKQGERVLDPDVARYVLRVHRLAPGDCFVVFDPRRGHEADAELMPMSQPGSRSQRRPRSLHGVRVRVGPTRPAALRPVRPVTLIQAIGKGAKLDAVVRDATELGATRVVATVSEHTVKRVRDGAQALQLERWQRIAIDAARQCGRGDVPEILYVATLAQALREAAPAEPGAVGLCLHPSGPDSLAEQLRALAPRDAVAVVVGPEGGLAPAELTLARSLGYQVASLGPTVLRTETVCAAMLGALMVLAPRDSG